MNKEKEHRAVYDCHQNINRNKNLYIFPFFSRSRETPTYLLLHRHLLPQQHLRIRVFLLFARVRFHWWWPIERQEANALTLARATAETVPMAQLMPIWQRRRNHCFMLSAESLFSSFLVFIPIFAVAFKHDLAQNSSLFSPVTWCRWVWQTLLVYNKAPLCQISLITEWVYHLRKKSAVMCG